MAVPSDLFELRLDYFDTIDLTALAALDLQRCILTLRPGKYSEEQRVNLLKQLSALKPAFIDIESTLSLKIDAPLILSYHNFEETPDLQPLWQQLTQTPARFYKIATKANSALDGWRLLEHMKKHPNCIAIGMGAIGQFTRILGPVFGAPITYASLEKETAPGQLSLQELTDTYRLPALNKETKIYGLIGYPLTNSLSPPTHNLHFKQTGMNAVYVKIPLTAAELPSFFKTFNFNGLSVTMPLKESVIPFLDALDEEARQIGAVNTIVCRAGKTIGYNTDGKGALNAIAAHLPVEGKRIIILGAGGAARAIIYEAKKRGAQVMILNRTPEKGELLARHFSVESIKSMEPYDILINCTPSDEPIDSRHLIPGTYVMDIRNRPKLTPFLERAAAQGCRLIFGEEMFKHQAEIQINLLY